MKKLWFQKRAGFLFLVVVLGMVMPVYGQYGPGTGDPDSPYEIWDPNQMNAIGADPNDWGKHFKLMADIDMSRFTGTQYNIIGNKSTPFTGTFDGNNHKISNLTYMTSFQDYVGLFGYLGYGGQIRNLGLVNVNVTGNDYVGGLVGRNSATITSSYTTGSVSGSYSVGGLVGYNNDGTIIYSCTTSSISGSDWIGGLVGYNFGTITSSYATGSISGGYIIGGLVGVNYGTITTSYATGLISENETAGGLVGWNSGKIISSVWDVEASGQLGSFGGMGLTNVQMKTMLIYQNAGWADQGWVINDGVDYPHLSWEETEGVPIPAAVIPFAGSGMAEDPYLISSAEEFTLLSWYGEVLDKHIRLTENLDLDNLILYPIGEMGSFTGVFDGNGNTISNAMIHEPGGNYVGLFGYLGEGGKIKNLRLVNVNVTGNNYVGELCGFTSWDAIITSCYAIGSVYGNDNVGGLVGGNYGTMTFCYTEGSVSGNDYVGGLLGRNGGTITSNYAMGPISGSSYVGGLVGYNYGTIISNYATGAVISNNDNSGLVGHNWSGTVISSFWDMETSGKTRSDGGKGLTTEQMKTMSIFQMAGWADHGWVIEDGIDYPRLSWEGTGGTAIPAAVIPFTGNGTVKLPYLVSTAEEFALLSWYAGILDKNIQLTANLDLEGITLYPIGVFGPFSGTFNGDGYTISNAVIHQPDGKYVGLFGYLGYGGRIKNLGLVNVNVNGSDYVGGLVGWNSGEITSSYITGSVSGSQGVGGLVGSNYYGTVTSNYTTGSVSGDYNIGGLVGYNELGTITCNYAEGAVNGYQTVGGLVGMNVDGAVTSSYSTGLVSGYGTGGLVGWSYNGLATNCFWDMETSGQSSSYGGEGKTTAQMQDINTYLAVGWDFTEEDGDGVEWMMLREGEDYPRLAWQETVLVPDVTGMQQAEAGTALLAVNLAAEITMAGSETVPAGQVISQSPVVGTEVLLGSVVHLVVSMGAITEIIIGTGSNSWEYPLSTFYHDARMQTIYLADEIGGACTIAALSLDVTTLPGQTMNGFTIRMKHSDLANYDEEEAQWESKGWTMMYQADETVIATGWVQFAFTTPFVYNGTQNLMVDISFNNSFYTSDGYCRYSTPGGTRSIYYRTDSGYGDPLAWSGNSNPAPNSTTYVPNIKLIFSGTTDLSADLNGDGEVNLEDAALLAAQWLLDNCESPGWCGGADMNQSGEVGVEDLAELAGEWMK